MAVGTPTSRSTRPRPSTGGGRGVSYGPGGNYSGSGGRPANNPRAPLPVLPGGGVPKAPPLPKRGGWPYAVLSLAYGAVSSTWFPPAIHRAPLAENPGLLTSMDFDPAAPYDGSKYRTNLTPRTRVPGATPVMLYDTFLEWAITGSPRAYWGPSWLWQPGTGYYPIHQPNGDPGSAPVPRKRPKPGRDPWSPPEWFPAFDIPPVPGVVPVPSPVPEPSPNPNPQPGAPYVPVARLPALNFHPSGAVWLSAPNGRPPKGFRERKSRSRAAAAILGIGFGIVNGVTELMDFIEAVLYGFGFDGPMTWAEMIELLLDIMENPGKYPGFDMDAFLRGLMYNHFEDKIAGRLNAALRKRLRDMGIRIYGGATPGYGWI